MSTFVNLSNFKEGEKAKHGLPGAPAWGDGGNNPPKQKSVVENWSYSPEVDKMNKVLEDVIENG